MCYLRYVYNMWQIVFLWNWIILTFISALVLLCNVAPCCCSVIFSVCSGVFFCASFSVVLVHVYQICTYKCIQLRLWMLSACINFPVICFSLHMCRWVHVLAYAYVWVSVCMLDALPTSQPVSQRTCQYLTFHPAVVSPSLLYISLSPSILHCLCLHQGKCQWTHLGIGLADPSRPGYIHSSRCPSGERKRENQSG